MFWRELEYPQTAGARTLAMKGVLLRAPCSLQRHQRRVLDRLEHVGAAVRVSCVAPSLTYRKADRPDPAMMKQRSRGGLKCSHPRS
jgi:hypothetical protein